LAFGGPASDFIGVQTEGAAGHANEFRLAFIAAVAPSPPHDRAGPATHSITSSARARIDGGTVSASALAVLRLMTSSNLVGCWTGRSAGLAPLRIFPT
jgi:hypothetical protein